MRKLAVVVLILAAVSAYAGDKRPVKKPATKKSQDFCTVMVGDGTGMYDDPSDCRDGKTRKVYCSGGKAAAVGPCM